MTSRTTMQTILHHEYGSNPMVGYVIEGGPAAIVLDPIAAVYGLDGAMVSIDTVAPLTRASTAMLRNSSGVLEEVAANVHRIDHDKEGNVLGLLIEEACTNELPYSEDFTMWSANNATVAADSMAIAGVRTAYLVTKTGANSRVRKTITVTGDVWSASFHFKPISGDVTINVDGMTNNEACKFNISSGTITASGAGAISWVLEDLGNGEYKITGEGGDTGADNSGGFNIYNNGSVILFGAMFVFSATMGSYVPTNGAAATRAADSIELPTSDFGYSDTVGTFITEFSARWDSIGYSLAMDNGDSADIVWQCALSNGKARSAVRSAGAWEMAKDSAITFTAGQFVKTAFAFAENDGAASYNGGAVLTDGSLVMPSAATMLNIGQSYFQNQQLNGHLKRLLYYPARISNAGLVLASAP